MRPDPEPQQPPQIPPSPEPPRPDQPEIPPIVPEPEVVPPSYPEKPDLPPMPRGHAGEEEAAKHSEQGDKGNAYKWSTDSDEQRDLILEGPHTRPTESDRQEE